MQHKTLQNLYDMDQSIKIYIQKWSFVNLFSHTFQVESNSDSEGTWAFPVWIQPQIIISNPFITYTSLMRETIRIITSKLLYNTYHYDIKTIQLDTVKQKMGTLSINVCWNLEITKLHTMVVRSQCLLFLSCNWYCHSYLLQLQPALLVWGG